jgi:purine-binding chemotaxis protein CheW
MHVDEVAREEKFTRMPDVPEYVLGIMNLRGIVIPIISVKRKLGIQEEALDDVIASSGTKTETVDTTQSVNTEETPQKDETKNQKENGLLTKLKRDLSNKSSQKLIIAKIDNVLVGFTVDELDRVFAIDDTEIQSAEGVASSIDKAMMEGMVRKDGEVYIILNIRKMLDVDDRKFINSEIIN